MSTPLTIAAADRQTALLRRAFERAVPLERFLQEKGSDGDRLRWQRVAEGVRLEPAQAELLAGFRRRMPVLCMAGAWCGDCARQCPVIAGIAAAAQGCELRFIDRDEDAELAGELRVCGAPRVPQVVWMSEDFEPVLRAGDRTLSQYRELAGRTTGAACSTGIAVPGDQRNAVIIREWLEQFELAQLILLTSPKLRQRHGF